MKEMNCGCGLAEKVEPAEEVEGGFVIFDEQVQGVVDVKGSVDDCR